MSLDRWLAVPGELVRTLVGHTGGVACVALWADGMTLASGSTDGTVLLWDVVGTPR